MRNWICDLSISNAHHATDLFTQAEQIKICGKENSTLSKIHLELWLLMHIMTIKLTIYLYIVYCSNMLPIDCTIETIPRKCKKNARFVAKKQQITGSEKKSWCSAYDRTYLVLCIVYSTTHSPLILLYRVFKLWVLRYNMIKRSEYKVSIVYVVDEFYNNFLLKTEKISPYWMEISIMFTCLNE